MGEPVGEVLGGVIGVVKGVIIGVVKGVVMGVLKNVVMVVIMGVTVGSVALAIAGVPVAVLIVIAVVYCVGALVGVLIINGPSNDDMVILSSKVPSFSPSKNTWQDPDAGGNFCVDKVVDSVEYVGNDSEGSVSIVDERVVVKTMNKTDF